jgi:hypothetical protein
VILVLENVIVACDTGNDTIKVHINGNNYFVSSIVKSNPRERLKFGGKDVGNPVDYLDVTVDINGIEGRFHVGELASYGENLESLGGLKSGNKMLIVCTLASIAYALATEHPTEEKFSITLGTGLPISEFFWINEEGNYDFSKVEDYKSKIAGRHRITFHTNLLDTKTITINIPHNNITVMPEGYSAIMSLLLGDSTDENLEKYKSKNSLAFCMDIGSISCDISAVMNSRYFPAGMFGFDMGMSFALDKLCQDLQHKTGIKDITRFEINKYLFDKDIKGIFKAGKQEINLNVEKKIYYKELAETISYRFREKLRDNGVDIRRISVLFLIGGGSLEIGKMIIENLNKDIPEFVMFKDTEAITMNLLGYEMAARGKLVFA